MCVCVLHVKFVHIYVLMYTYIKCIYMTIYPLIYNIYIFIKHILRARILESHKLYHQRKSFRTMI